MVLSPKGHVDVANVRHTQSVTRLSSSYLRRARTLLSTETGLQAMQMHSFHRC